MCKKRGKKTDVGYKKCNLRFGIQLCHQPAVTVHLVIGGVTRAHPFDSLLSEPVWSGFKSPPS